MADVIGQLRDMAGRVAAGHGLELFDVQFRREAGGMVLRVQIDRPGPASRAEDSVSVDDCVNDSTASQPRNPAAPSGRTPVTMKSQALDSTRRR